jgi:hypothetical protein
MTVYLAIIKNAKNVLLFQLPLASRVSEATEILQIIAAVYQSAFMTHLFSLTHQAIIVSRV